MNSFLDSFLFCNRQAIFLIIILEREREREVPIPLSVLDADAIEGVGLCRQNAVTELEGGILEPERVPLDPEAFGLAGAAHAGLEVAPVADVPMLDARFVLERDEAPFAHQERQSGFGLYVGRGKKKVA